MADKMQRVVAEPFGDRRARCKAHKHAEPDQHTVRTQAPAIDGPPPPSHGVLIDSGEFHVRAVPGFGKLPTSRRNSSPRASKLANWSNEAQAGDSSTTASRSRSARAC